ncbi:hypothetical protein SISSUDRAFT_734179 [Sistotremastrum suecicum HHB10207 ss-3]|uniref:Uncharacterized protein n=1 Tax=Sistotremastrum suecicum HHB10207 ss-3 TaxID=1314776 RepID=A0A166DGA7_9AGAM|nr:hypothetical protein SISSUDRAFT_734179 [Sistotremastrum suecicum HHB10207 ss-3]
MCLKQSYCAKFWSIPELVKITFAFLEDERSALATCAVLSKALSEHALDTLYREGLMLEDVLRVLSPMPPNAPYIVGESLESVGSISMAQWDRFRHYSHRIRKLSHSAVSKITKWIPHKFWVMILVSLPRGQIFLPSLVSLHWLDVSSFSSQAFLIFLHEGLKELRLALEIGNTLSALEYLPHRVPRLELLELWRAHEDDSDNGSESNQTTRNMVVEKVLKSFPGLRSVGLSPSLANLDMVKDLAARPCLEVLRLSSFAVRRHASLSENLGSGQGSGNEPSCSKSPKFRELSITTDIFFELPIHTILGSQLVILFIQISPSAQISDTLQMEACLKLIYEHSRYLKDLSLISDWHRTSEDSDPPPPLTMSILSHLLKMQNIEALLIEHPTPPNVTDGDMQQLASSLPELRHFELCVRAHGEYDYEVPSMVSWMHFATSCKKLVSFGIFLDVDPAKNWDPEKLSPTRFTSSLETLHVFCSPIEDQDEDQDKLGNFLAAVLPFKCTLEICRISPRLQFMAGDIVFHSDTIELQDFMDQKSQQYRRTWFETSCLLDKMARTRCIMSEILAENEELRQRLSVFEK